MSRTLSSIRQKQGTCLARGRRPDMMKSTELAVRSRATAPQGGAVFCKSVGVLQAAVRNELWLISEPAPCPARGPLFILERRPRPDGGCVGGERRRAGTRDALSSEIGRAH